MLEAGAQHAVLEASAAREEPRDQLPQGPVSSAGHTPAPTQETLGDQGLLVTVWPWLLSPARLAGEPGTAGPGWHCHLCASRHLIPQKGASGTARRTQHPHRHRGTAADTSAAALASLPHHPVAVPLLGLRDVSSACSGWEAVACSQDDAQAQLWLRQAGGMDRPSRPSTFPWVLTGGHSGGRHFSGRETEARPGSEQLSCLPAMAVPVSPHQ